MASLRRVVTGINSAGRSAVISDEVLPEPAGGISAVTIYSSFPSATVPVRELPTEHVPSPYLPPHATSWVVIEFAPSEETNSLPRLHTTDTLDYLVVRSGELTMFLDDGVEVVLREGDYLVQGGVAHGWANRSGAPCVAECIIVGVPREEA